MDEHQAFQGKPSRRFICQSSSVSSIQQEKAQEQLGKWLQLQVSSCHSTIDSFTPSEVKATLLPVPKAMKLQPILGSAGNSQTDQPRNLAHAAHKRAVAKILWARDRYGEVAGLSPAGGYTAACSAKSSSRLILCV